MLDTKQALSTEDLGSVSGGMIVNDTRLPEYDASCPWEVVQNDNCRVLGKFPTYAGAEKYAKSFGPESYNAQITDLETVMRLRANPQGNG